MRERPKAKVNARQKTKKAKKSREVSGLPEEEEAAKEEEKTTTPP